MVKLGVNIDHVATLRQARGTPYPQVDEAARICVAAGADGITVHLREDRRHIQLYDVEKLREQLSVPLNLEMAATTEMLAIATRIKPDEVCLVPEKREELTTEGGLDAASQIEYLKSYCGALREKQIHVSLFIDPIQVQIQAAKNIGANIVELHTGRYAEQQIDFSGELGRLATGAEQALDLGLVVNAGHGLNYDNVMPIARLPGINCLNIGHSIIARAVFTGLSMAVSDMLVLLRDAEG